MEKETKFSFKVYAPLEIEYDGTLSATYKGTTDEKNPKAVFELEFDRYYLMKHIIASNETDHQKLLEIISEIDKKEVEFEEKQKEIEKMNERQKIIRDFCNRYKEDGGKDLSSYCESYIQHHFVIKKCKEK